MGGGQRHKLGVTFVRRGSGTAELGYLVLEFSRSPLKAVYLVRKATGGYGKPCNLWQTGTFVALITFFSWMLTLFEQRIEQKESLWGLGDMQGDIEPLCDHLWVRGKVAHQVPPSMSPGNTEMKLLTRNSSFQANKPLAAYHETFLF